MESATKRFLHVGCGPLTKKHLKGFLEDDWTEVRFDIDPDVNPDIIGTITDMTGVESESVDAVYSAHNVEHVFPHLVPNMLSEFHRVLKPNGFLLVTCPDLLAVSEAIIRIGIDEVLYESPMGPITPLDILFGHIASVQSGNEYMAHKGGFTLKSLMSRLQEAGFLAMMGNRRPQHVDLWVLAYKGDVEEADAEMDRYRYMP
ncbi:MAG: methyltransferase domain-containing protein [bacterium]